MLSGMLVHKALQLKGNAVQPQKNYIFLVSVI